MVNNNNSSEQEDQQQREPAAADKPNLPGMNTILKIVETLLNETIVTLRLTKKHYKTVYTLAHMLGFKSLDDYISNIVVHNTEMEITGCDINYDREKLF
jgi:hypothetical protein